jgi:hypothetical protein
MVLVKTPARRRSQAWTLSTSPTALRPVKRIIRIVLMAPDWAPADRRSLDARTIALR